ncbi:MULTISPECIES: type III pantothenate kinase [Dethiosulfovibrio]|jgi:type III pantothenate kinase|uniref:Type III pantothenate kinase n=2 Tax=Dethiosulfovibrio TaxID=47054 RepID=A0ABS9EKT2_9BACT|nr:MULTISPECIES: type III pantothenate kinase [Dethiosulfovibrio]MCF4113778.1 type III pantothenate kinase [Dethiosulfovibrio russensis]MCF4141809.1 type III pantothenate kinase [Dethiosulfovibrio marinus]MCF4143773.1 type III pantothenate kinase [Dethiosulfovibrio acidaminovorans]MEA3285301.1 type III pantothenate kinase [Synergistota bacterium]
MILVIDVGNTTTVIGVFEGDRLVRHWRLVSERKTSDEVGILLLNLLMLSSISPSDITGAAMSSVVPSLDLIIAEAVESYIGVGCIRVNADLDIGLLIAYENRWEVGADRLVNSVAGISKYGAPLIVVDFGTAITLDVISEDGAYLGGTISPGLVTSMDALFGKTSKLPQVALEAPGSVIGKNTRWAIQSGVVYGTAGSVDALVRRIWKQIGSESPVIATGGHSATVASVSETISSLEPWLTLEGLRLIYDRLT